MPSSVSAHRLSGRSVTSAPHGAWSNPSSRNGDERVLAGVAARAVAAVVADRHRLDEGDVEAQRRRDRAGDLGDFERVGHPVALMITGKDEDLGLARQAPERRIVENSVPVPLEARPIRIGFLLDRSVAGPGCLRGVRCENRSVAILASLTRHDLGVADGGRRIGVRHHDPVVCMSGHRRRPAVRPFLGIVHEGQIVHLPPGYGPVGVRHAASASPGPRRAPGCRRRTPIA